MRHRASGAEVGWARGFSRAAGGGYLAHAPFLNGEGVQLRQLARHHHAIVLGVVMVPATQVRGGGAVDLVGKRRIAAQRQHHSTTM